LSEIALESQYLRIW